MKLVTESHVDHGLTESQLAWVLSRFEDRDGFFIESVELPDELGTVPCGLHGPLMGDGPVPDAEVRLVARGDREWTSRLCDRQPRLVSTVTVIAGPHGDDACVLYTAFGGPLSPQEPGDPGCKDVSASEQFWATHALSA